jgi:hypothetical protein
VQSLKLWKNKIFPRLNSKAANLIKKVTFRGIIVANVLNSLSHNLLVIHFGSGCYFAADQDHAGFRHSLYILFVLVYAPLLHVLHTTRHSCVFVLLEVCVQNRVTDLVAHFVCEKQFNYLPREMLRGCCFVREGPMCTTDAHWKNSMQKCVAKRLFRS